MCGGEADDRQAHFTGMDELERMGRADCWRRDGFYPGDMFVEELCEGLANREVTAAPRTRADGDLRGAHPENGNEQYAEELDDRNCLHGVQTARPLIWESRRRLLEGGRSSPTRSRHRTDVGRGGREGVPQNLLGIVHEDESHLLPQLLRHVLDVPLVQARQNDGTDPSPMRRQDLFLDSSDGEHLAAERDLAGYGQLIPYRRRVAKEASAVMMVTPAEGLSLGIAPAGTCT